MKKGTPMYKATATIYVVSRNDSVLNFSDLQVGSELTSDVSRQELLDVKQQIEQTGCPILGTVLNQVDYDNYMGRKYYKSYSKYGKYGYYKSIISGATKQKRNERLYGLSCALRLRCGRRRADAGRNVCHAGCGRRMSGSAPVWDKQQHKN